MRDRLQSFAIEFSNHLEKMTLEDLEQRSVHYPVVFLFLGDKVLDALKSIMTINDEKWHNSAGVVYFHVYQTETINKDNVFSAQLPGQSFDTVEKRKKIFETFYEDDSKLIEINRTIRSLSSKVAENGKSYSSLERLNLCVITAIDDPANILIQEMTLLLKSILHESFKSIEVDLYGLIKEKQDEDNYALAAANGISFLKELDSLQHDHYSFHQELQLTDDLLRIPVSHSSAPLFDLVFLLSDKNETGLISSEAIQQNYEMISHLNLLKNRKLIKDYHEKMDSYNHAAFRLAIKGNHGKPVYASAGFAKVNVPTKAIALNAASLFCAEMIEMLKTTSVQPLQKILDLLELNEAAFEKHFTTLLPSYQKLEDMNGLLGMTTSFQEVRKMTVKQAEDFLYDGGTRKFFFTNIEEPLSQELKQLKLKAHIQRILDEKIINNDQYGIYCAYLWTSEWSEQSVRLEAEKITRETKKQLMAAEATLEQLYQQQVDTCDFKRSFLPFSDKKNLQSYQNYFFETVYGTKYQILTLQIKLVILTHYQQALEEKHHSLRRKIDDIDQVHSYLKQTAAESLYDEDEYLGKNIPEYYKSIVHEIVNRLKEKRGPNFFSDERFFGNLLSLLDGSANGFLERLLEVCRREVLSQEEFQRSFEDELLQRANVNSVYENKDILSKDELFKHLYLNLQENAAVHIQVYNYSQEHRHEENYFVGDFYSTFMTYALEKENEASHYKVGCAHEKKSSGMEKLVLMGGFQSMDLLYYRNGERYYQAYLRNGYHLHADSSSLKGENHARP
ncbi:tubulin-like doman-containing protein [Neobacillus niacini]|uniref:tubulin-like doman-containing protein n=1 Tax=Neobacillus niacini TaxID=86668 RepID=UPI002FFEE17A